MDAQEKQIIAYLVAATTASLTLNSRRFTEATKPTIVGLSTEDADKALNKVVEAFAAIDMNNIENMFNDEVKQDLTDLCDDALYQVDVVMNALKGKTDFENVEEVLLILLYLVNNLESLKRQISLR